MPLVTAFLAGILFGSGLILSGMTNPAKVLAFLDLAGRWDPSLAFVMVGAILVAAIGFRLAGRRGRSLSGGKLHLPGTMGIDRRLMLGSLTFGVGWGLVGYCPGPAIATLAVGGRPTLMFVGAMIAGMTVFEVIERLACMRAARLHPPAHAGE
ncbi:YeeE/YedE family protein [Massilia phyllosphaerae]|uniref:YeeE/YedE family protein n=1 Tax=Massilia phyllosphaerae TaxID=3106034 RepID=UPI002B1CD395|nr:YeeE/YedE family protein [Massilia sp. SGZ-792]